MSNYLSVDGVKILAIFVRATETLAHAHQRGEIAYPLCLVG